MYPNIPKKMRLHEFKDAVCPKNSKLYASCLNLTIPKYPSGQTAYVDVDPIEALNRADAAAFAEFAGTGRAPAADDADLAALQELYKKE